MSQDAPFEARFAAMREALEAALQAHVRLGKAQRCDCSQCVQIRAALDSKAGQGFAERIREECAQVADWKADQLSSQLAGADPAQTELIRAALKVVREVGDRIRVLKERQY
jgi:hypothetical protein